MSHNFVNTDKINEAPFRYDVVGSFLRPQGLKEAREKFLKGAITEDELRKVEDEQIKKLVEKQKEVGLKAVTDGEFRRRYWHLDFLAALEGVEEIKADHWSVDFKGHQPKAATLKIVDKIDFTTHPFIEHFKFLKGISGDHVAKMTIPSPSMLHLIACVRAEQYTPIKRYENNDTLYFDIAAAYQKIIQAFYDAGCRYLQLDDTSWGEFCDMEKRSAYAKKGIDLDVIAEKYVDMINLAVQKKPADMTITMHVCRGNFRSTWFSSGGYKTVAEPLFSKCNVDGFFLEYDTDRAGDFIPLKAVSKGKKVVLGLVSSKTGELENKEQIIARIHEASAYIPLDSLCLSPQCGFASTEEGNVLTEEQQWGKIAFIKEVAEQIWG